MMAAPLLKLYDPPLDYGEDEEEEDVTSSTDEPQIDRTAGYATFLTCLLIGATTAALIWGLAAVCVFP